ncbi:GNAT family N-acetyltransferase [Candidatus Roizmanbacteria bacterium]|nr:GNAT family N-acetyltransferase [Candidatus Roizmanbacteria bacterium]
MQIISLTRKDIESILKLESESAPEKPDYIKYSPQELQDLFDNLEKCRAFGIYSDNELIGWSGYKWIRGNLYEITPVVVGKNYRGKGLGKALLEYAVKEVLRNHKDAEIFLTVYPQNLDALNLYLKNNFVVYDFKKDYYGQGADRLFLKHSK